MAKKKAPEAGTESFIVSNSFHDIDNYDKVYEVGEDVSDLGDDRLDTLIGLGLVELSKAE